jgi:hypothetical protein
MSVSLVIGLVGVVLALISLLFTIRATRHERSDRVKSLQLLDRQLGVLAKQVDQERDQFEQTSRAIITQAGVSECKLHGQGCTVTVTLANAGPASARHVTTWLISEDGERLTRESPAPAGLFMPSEIEREVTLSLASIPREGKAFLEWAWQDLEGERHFGRSSVSISLPDNSDQRETSVALSDLSDPYAPDYSDRQSRPFVYSSGSLSVGDPGTFHADLEANAGAGGAQLTRGRIEEQEDGSFVLSLYGGSTDERKAAEEAIVEWAQAHGLRLEI